MNRLRKFTEVDIRQQPTARTAYVLKPETLPAPHSGCKWIEDSSFNAAEAILADASLKEVFTRAIASGHAIMKRKQ